MSDTLSARRPKSGRPLTLSLFNESAPNRAHEELRAATDERNARTAELRRQRIARELSNEAG